jgi:hypothetical protein
LIVELHVAGCRLRFSLRREGRMPVNLLDLDLSDPETAAERAWTIDVEPAAGIDRTPGWTPSENGQTFTSEGFDVRFDESRRACLARFDGAIAAAQYGAAQHAAFGALRREGRADLHGAAVCPPGSDQAVVLIGESGRGKSTLTSLAIASGWGFVSDDLLAVFADDDARIALAPLRRSLRLTKEAAELLSPGVELGERWNQEVPPKLTVDPGHPRLVALRKKRVTRARPSRLVFLERGPVRESAPLTKIDAFQRLLEQAPHLAFDPGARRAFAALRRLADEVPSTREALPLNCLHDAATLESFLAQGL